MITVKPPLRGVTGKSVSLETKGDSGTVGTEPPCPTCASCLAASASDSPCLLLPPQNVMLELSKRSRSGKFRLVTKFKKEKNSKNREARSSLGAPGTRPPAVLLAVHAGCGGHCGLCFFLQPFGSSPWSLITTLIAAVFV